MKIMYTTSLETNSTTWRFIQALGISLFYSLIFCYNKLFKKTDLFLKKYFIQCDMRNINKVVVVVVIFVVVADHLM